jgi:hypothetical protein
MTSATSPAPQASVPSPVEARLGPPEYYRVWCSAEGIPLNEYHCVEFCGWPIAWEDAALDPPVDVASFRRSGPPATHGEVDIYLTTDGKVVSVVELLCDEPREFRRTCGRCS